MMKKFKGLLKLLNSNPSEQDCIDFLEKRLWKEEMPKSPFDPTSKVIKCADQATKSKYPVKYTRYKCENTGKYFNVKTRTIFENTKIPLLKWFWALYFLSKGAICSYKLADHISISVTQKTAWLMKHKLRRAFKCPLFDVKLKGEWEGDEVFLGGANPNRHWNKKVPKCQGRNWKDKIAVFVMEQRGGNAIAKQVPNVKRKTLFPIIRANAEENSSAYTDEYPVYKGLDKLYNHQIVVHKMGQYVKQYADSKKASTNLVENFNSHLNKMIYGIYIMISRKHAQNYLDEFTFRRNTRKYDDEERCELILSLTVGKRLTYQQLINS